MTAPIRLRTGRSVGRTLYRQVGPEPSKADVLIGVVDTPELARLIVAAVAYAEADSAYEPVVREYQDADPSDFDGTHARLLEVEASLRRGKTAYRAAREQVSE